MSDPHGEDRDDAERGVVRPSADDPAWIRKLRRRPPATDGDPDPRGTPPAGEDLPDGWTPEGEPWDDPADPDDEGKDDRAA